MLCKTLKKTKRELLSDMGSVELTKWMAFLSLENEEYKLKIEKEVSKEESEQMTEEQRAEAIRNLFKGLRKSK